MRIESQAGVFGVRPQNLAVCGHFSLDGDTWAAVLRQLAGEGLGAAFDEVNLRSEEEDEDEDSSSEDSSEDSSVGEIEGDLDTRTRADWEEWVRLEAEGLAATCRRVAGDPEHFEPLPARLMHEAFKGLTGARKRNRERERARWNRRRRRKQEDLQERRREDSLVAHLSGLRIASSSDLWSRCAPSWGWDELWRYLSVVCVTFKTHIASATRSSARRWSRLRIHPLLKASRLTYLCCTCWWMRRNSGRGMMERWRGK